jgi:hypothetical protein
MKSVPRLAGVLVLVLAIAGLLWLGFTGSSEVDPVSPQREVAAAPATGDPDLQAPAPDRAPSERAVAEAELGPAEVLAAEVLELAGTYYLGLRFMLPDRTDVRLYDVTAHLTNEDGRSWTFTAPGPVHELSCELGFGVYRLAVEAAGHRHVPETLDLSSAQRFQDGDPVQGFLERVYVWSEDRIPIVLRTRDGRPFHAIAADLGYEPKRFFVDAFGIVASHDPIDPHAPLPDAPHATGESELARFLPPKGWQNVRIADDVIGSLEMLEARPFWVGLWIHGEHFESRFLEATDTELVFEIDLADLDRRFASVSVRLVDRDSGAPVTRDAKATLKANTSAHRRNDLNEVTPDASGDLLFERVVPGQHELAITRGSNFVQRQLDVRPGEHLNLGDVSIGLDEPLILRVVDANGEPAAAVIEMAPYERGGSVDALYHPSLHRRTNGDGVYELPVPDRRSILRARPMFLRGTGFRGDYTIGTRNVLVDPSNLPDELELVVQFPVEMTLEPETPWIDGHLLTIEDEALELIVATVVDLGRRLDLVPGRYLVRRRDAAGGEVGARVVFVTVGSPTIRVP